MKILITGAKGQLGKKLAETLAGNDLILTDSDDMDITDKTNVNEVISQQKPDFIVHAAAYTAVDKAEEERELCYKVNALGTKNLAEIAQKNDITLLYISTDYVFSGAGHTPLKETDPTNPVNYYGQTKLDGENLIRDLYSKYYILRTAWLYGELPKDHPGSNFVETMLKLANSQPEVKVVNDQIGSPTYTKDLCAVIVRIIERFQDRKEKISRKVGSNSSGAGSSSNETIEPSNNVVPYGVYHVTGEGEASWFDFAGEIFRQTKTNAKLTPIPTSEFPRPAKRPAYSYLSKEKLNSVGITTRPWQEALAEYLKNR